MKHKSFNRTLATLLSVMLMVGLLPTTVFAAENYNIIVSGTQLTSDNASDVLGDGTVSYDHETKTLTLDNADLKGGILISQENAVNISIQGENKITSDNYGIAKNAYPTDPTTPGGLCVSGPGSLVVTAQTNGIEAYRELVIDNVDLEINTQQFSLVSQSEGDLIIKNGSDITATSDNFPTVVGGEIEILGSKTDVTAYAPGVNVLYASSGNISIDKSNVIARNKSEDAYPTIWVAKDMTVTNSSVSAESEGESGISVTGTLSLTNSELFASCDPTYWAIVTEHFNVTNSKATAKGGLYLYSATGAATSFSITPADGKLVEFKVDNDTEGSKAEHFSDGVESPYDATVNFNENEQLAISGYSYVYIGEHIHIGGTATCEDPAVCEDCGRPYGNALGHSYSEPVWNWSEDGKTCTVTFTCSNDETHKETQEAKVTLAGQTPATCTEAGVTTYTATVEFNGQTYTDTKDVADIPATGHSYSEPVWNWSEDGKTCTVTFTCSNDETHKETQEAKVTLAGQTPATCTEAGVTTYTATVEFNGQTYTDTKDVADIPATGHSYEDGKCTVCGAIAPDFKVVITAGANGTWQKGAKDGLSFTSNASYEHFQKVQVDGKDLDASNYTVKEGSTIVTLKASYLETLSVGKHTLSIVSDTGTAATEFTIKAAPAADNTQSPQTGDSSNLTTWFIVMLTAGTALSCTLLYSRKRKYSK